MSTYFITSTGTGVGKTFTTCALLAAARKQGVAARAFKPIISGWDDSDASDTAQIIAAGGGEALVEHISPWRFKAPLSAHRAAALEDKQLLFDVLVDWAMAQKMQDGLTLIEAVGGVMVPLNEEETTLDWMAATGCKVILVVGSYLGAISHTLTAMKALETAGVEIAALVMTETEDSAVDFEEAQAGLASFISNIPLRIFQPRVSSWDEAAEIAALVKQL